MSRFKIAILILIFSVSASIGSTIYVQSTCAALTDKVNSIITSIGKKDKALVIEHTSDAIDYFEKIKPCLNIIEGQGSTIEIRGDLNKAIFFINMKDYQSAILHLEECKTDLNRIIVSNTPSISTIL